MTQLILGTAQFGTAYGVTNAQGRIGDADVQTMLELAAAGGVSTFDTAPDYGDAQSRLGALAAPGNRYVTKFHLPRDGSVPSAERLYGRSMKQLGVSSLAGLMFHHLDDLRDGARLDATLAVLEEARAEGTIDRVGASIYDIDNLELALAAFPTLDLLQFPANILDGRLLESERLRELHDSGVELHVRSAFLQGLMLVEPDGLPERFAGLRPALEALRATAAEHDSTVLGIALRYLRDHPLVDGVVVGATRPWEVTAILAEWQSEGPVPPDLRGMVPAALLDPRNWASE